MVHIKHRIFKGLPKSLIAFLALFMVTNDQVDEIERFLKFLGNIFLQKYSLAFGAYFEKTLVILLSGNFGEIGLLFSLTFCHTANGPLYISRIIRRQ